MDLEPIQEWLSYRFLGNPVSIWLTAGALLVGGVTLLTLARRVLAGRLERIAHRTESPLDDVLLDLVRRTRFYFIVLVSLAAATQALALPGTLGRLIRVVAVFAVAAQVAVWGNGVIAFALRRYAERRAMTEGAGAATIGLVDFLARVGLWAVVLLLALSNLGYNVTALLTGLGIGGIAVALAVQNILGDIFAALSIVLDKPFVVGDFIVVDNFRGNIEHIGLKSTRIRSLGGEQIIFSNSELLRARISNFKRMAERRIQLTIGVTYQTPREKLARIPGMLSQIVSAQSPVRVDRSHFRAFGPSSYDFEVIFWVLDPDYKLYMDIQQQINLDIVERFEAESIEIAYPTQTLFVHGTAGGDGRGGAVDLERASVP